MPAVGWRVEDSQLALALDAFEQTRVGAFGFPKRLTEGDWEGWFEVELVPDHAQQAYDLWRRNQREDPPPGLVPRVVFTGNEIE